MSTMTEAILWHRYMEDHKRNPEKYAPRIGPPAPIKPWTRRDTLRTVLTVTVFFAAVTAVMTGLSYGIDALDTHINPSEAVIDAPTDLPAVYDRIVPVDRHAIR